MATSFRATVMLIVLVGLPSAWVYYGPLPPSAMGVIERTVSTARQSLGWEETALATQWVKESAKAAPRFDSSLAEASHVLRQQTARELATESAALPIPVTRRDPQFSLASATQPARTASIPLPVGDDLARQLNPHLSLLRSQGAADYALEKWGNGGGFIVFVAR